MTKAEKAEVIDYLTEEFKAAGGIAVCDYKGMTVKEIEDLRNRSREKELKVKVVKNTLAAIALKNAELEGVELKETNIMLWGEDQVTLAKLITEYAKDNEEKFKIKAGLMDGVASSEAQIEAISKLPSKEQLIGMLLSTWMAPVRNMASVLQAPMRDMANVLENVRKQKEESA